MVNKEQRIIAVFSALADSTRLRILEELSRNQETPASDLARPFHISMPAISRHLRVLEHARLIRRRRKGRLHLIRARADGLKEAHKWMLHYAAHWDSAFDALDELLKKERKT
jgi:DNA-binding transcriptional ArsR family regulator